MSEKKKRRGLGDLKIVGRYVRMQESQIDKKLDYLADHEPSDPRTSRKVSIVIAILVVVAVAIIAIGYWFSTSGGSLIERGIVVGLLVAIGAAFALQCFKSS